MPDLEELYREIILDHYRSPRNRGELDSPPAHRVEGFNPLCGDEVVVTILVEDGQLADIKIAGIGCSISQSSASLMSAAVKGKPLQQVAALISTFKSLMSIHGASLGDDDGQEGPTPRAGALGNGHAPGISPDGRTGEPHATDSGDTADTEPVDLAKLGELAALQGVVKFPVRIKCATLSWNALAQGLRELEGTPG